MAEMLPAKPTSATASEAERHLFRRFRDEAPDDWLVLHSLGLRSHARKPWAEADFVVINGAGVVVVEVKGGLVKRQARDWSTNGHPLRESPFDQAAGAMAALHHDLRSSVPQISDGLVMSAVAFPDVVFDKDGPDLVPAIVYDHRSRVEPLTRWFDRVHSYWRAKVDGGRDVERRGLSRAVRAQLLDRLAGDFDLRPSLRATLGEIDRDLVRYTAQQARIVEALAQGNPRMIVTGGAGTGKTWLALEETLRVARSGRRALLMCHTKALAAWLAGQIGSEVGVDVTHFNGLTTELIKGAGLWNRLSDASDDHRLRVEHPELALEALCSTTGAPLYDVVVVDEAQDILTVPALHLIDGLVSGGLDNGCWRLFLDPYQDILDGTDVATSSMLKGYRPTRFPLSINCRNTAEIALQTAVMARRSLAETLPVSGPQPVYFEFEGERDQRRRATAVLRAWLDAGVPPEDIMVLGYRRLGSTCFADRELKGLPATLVEGTRSSAGRRQIRYSTVASFKGLESNAVLVLDVGPISQPKAARDVYVAMSRAKSLLAVGVDARFSEVRIALNREFGARVSAGTSP